MGATQIWQQDGCGIDEKSIRRVIGEFRENGVQGDKKRTMLDCIHGKAGRHSTGAYVRTGQGRYIADSC